MGTTSLVGGGGDGGGSSSSLFVCLRDGWERQGAEEATGCGVVWVV